MSLATSSIILRRMDFSEYDYIIDFLTRDHGKLSAIAKNAKKSKKRFAGVLEPFSCLEANFSISKRGNLLLLKEAVLTHPFAGLRKDAEKRRFSARSFSSLFSCPDQAGYGNGFPGDRQPVVPDTFHESGGHVARTELLPDLPPSAG